MLGFFRGHPRLAKLIGRRFALPGLADSVNPTAGKLGKSRQVLSRRQPSKRAIWHADAAAL
jgi:hypothetical protein